MREFKAILQWSQNAVRGCLSLAGTVLLLQSSASALTVDDFCAPAADPCVFAGSATSSVGVDLDFGMRAFTLASGGEITLPNGGTLKITARTVVLESGSTVTVPQVASESVEIHTTDGCRVAGAIISRGALGSDGGNVILSCGAGGPLVIADGAVIDVNVIGLVDGGSVAGGGGGAIELYSDVTSTVTMGIQIEKGSTLLGTSKGGYGGALIMEAYDAPCSIAGAVNLSAKPIKIDGVKKGGEGGYFEAGCGSTVVADGSSFTLSKNKDRDGGYLSFYGVHHVSVGKIKVALSGIEATFEVGTDRDPGDDCEFNTKVGFASIPGQLGGELVFYCHGVTLGDKTKVTGKNSSSVQMNVSGQCDIAGSFKLGNSGTFDMDCDAGSTFSGKLKVSGSATSANRVDITSDNGPVVISGSISVKSDGNFNDVTVEGCDVNLTEESSLSSAGAVSGLSVVAHHNLTLDGKIKADPGPVDLRYLGTVSPAMPDVDPATTPVQDNTLSACM